jgi:hypothetical protein
MPNTGRAGRPNADTLLYPEVNTRNAMPKPIAANATTMTIQSHRSTALNARLGQARPSSATRTMPIRAGPESPNTPPGDRSLVFRTNAAFSLQNRVSYWATSMATNS